MRERGDGFASVTWSVFSSTAEVESALVELSTGRQVPRKLRYSVRSKLVPASPTRFALMPLTKNEPPGGWSALSPAPVRLPSYSVPLARLSDSPPPVSPPPVSPVEPPPPAAFRALAGVHPNQTAARAEARGSPMLSCISRTNRSV